MNTTILNYVQLSQAVSGGIFYDNSDGAGGTDIGLIGAVNVAPPNNESTWIAGADAAGGIFGTYLTSGTEWGFVDNNGAYTDIVFPSSVQTTIYSVDNNGYFVGQYLDSKVLDHSFYESAGAYSNINVPWSENNRGATTLVGGINPTGEVFGQYSKYVQTTHGAVQAWYGFTELNGVYTTVDPANALSCNVYGVNSEGVVFGDYTDPISSQVNGFVENEGAYTSIEFPGATSTEVIGVDQAGEAIGLCWNASGVANLFIESGGSYAEIANPIAAKPTQGIAFTGSDISVDSAGDVAGSYVDASDNIHGFLWNRASESFTTVLGFSQVLPCAR